MAVGGGSAADHQQEAEADDRLLLDCEVVVERKKRQNRECGVEQNDCLLAAVEVVAVSIRLLAVVDHEISA